MRIAIYADEKSGMGHVVRCRVLLEELRIRGHKAYLSTDWQGFVKCCRERKPNAVVIDAYEPPMYENVLAPVVVSIPDDIEPLGPKYAMLRRQYRELRAQSLELAGTSERQCIAITSGGQTALEFACVGTPVVAWKQYENQHVNLDPMISAGVTPKCDTHEEATQIASELMHNPKELGRMAAAGMELVDGEGCSRVADLIEERVRGA